MGSSCGSLWKKAHFSGFPCRSCNGYINLRTQQSRMADDRIQMSCRSVCGYGSVSTSHCLSDESCLQETLKSTIRSMITENSTAKTQARAFSFFAFAGNLGIFIGPLIGMSHVGPGPMRLISMRRRWWAIQTSRAISIGLRASPAIQRLPLCSSDFCYWRDRR